MFSTRSLPMPALAKIAALSALAALSLSACAQSRLTLHDGFGREVRADLVAQVADPDAKYSGDPAPASNGSRASLAQTRYEKGTVVEPASTSTSTVGGGGGR
jgi:hypothetical protein